MNLEELTPDQLKVLLGLPGQVAELQSQVAELKLQVSANSLQKAIVEKAPSIPENNVKVDGKEYKWRKSKFKLLADPTLYLAEEAQHDETLVKKIVSIPGQRILQEQV